MAKTIAIAVEDLGKCYRVFSSPRARLAQGLWPGKRRFYEPFWALQNISFSLEAGKTLGIIGRNGSGKSTLLQLICGTLTPSTGSVRCHGRVAALLELGSGFNPEFTGIENVYLNATLLGLSEEETNNKLDRILAFADIGDFIHQPVKSYSSGMTVRLAFAVQAMIRPDVLIVDEALAVGDELFQKKCFQHLESLKDEGTSILLVTHNCGQIVQHCDEALMLHQGNLVCAGKPKEITVIYQRLANSSPENIIEEARSLHSQLVGLREKEQEQTQTTHPVSGFSQAQQHYDQRLKPESTTIYPSRGIRIEDIQVVDEQNNQINILEQGQHFIIRISYFTDEDLDHLQLACNLANHSGQVITGQRFPELGQGLEIMKAGKAFECSFTFQANLLPGVYFVSAGAWNTPDRNYLHRIVDAAAIRVIPTEKPNYGFGLTNLGLGKPQLSAN